ncbi:gamma-glutamylcyclotransferase family protein [Haloferacaceae archaeon DSL9]
MSDDQRAADDRTTDVFVYGTLTQPERVASLLESYAFVGDAVLSGLHAVDGRYPTLAPGGEIAGRLLRTAEIDVLDAYEGVNRGLYARVHVPVVSKRADRSAERADRRAAVYIGDPERLEAAEPVSWPGTGPLVDRIQQYLRTNGVSIRHTR